MRWAIPLLLALNGCSAAPSGGGGIVSTNPCADAILLELVPPEQVAAISRYSQDPAATSIPIDVARRFRGTAGTAEEVIAMAPDLVLTSSFTPAATRRAYARAGLRTLVMDSPTSVAASEAQVMQIAHAVGEEARGRALVEQIEHTFSTVGTEGEQAAVPAALLFIGGDLVNGSGTLLDELMRRTGFRNAAADYGLAFTGTLPIETIAMRPPAVVIAPDAGRTAALRARVLAATGVQVKEAAFPRRLINCGGPTIVPAMRRLAAIRRTLS